MKSCCETATLPTVRSASSLPSDRPVWNTYEDSPSSSYSLKIPSTWTVGKVSLVCLLLAVTGMVHDAMSTNVVRPNVSGAPRSKSSLGSAAISSVTEALSPILPFTGGVDLRREEYRTSSPWETVQSLYTQTVDAFASANAYASSKTFKEPSTKFVRRVKADRPMVLSATEPFVKTKLIAELTLADVTEAFRYATESNKEGFDEAKFLRKLDHNMKQIITSMKNAVEQSRGSDAQDSFVLATQTPVGSMDALKFSAAMRIFAEWRLLRQVPEGYKGFAVGMSLGHKDVVQNVVKIEQRVHDWLDFQSDEMEDDNSVLRSPTIAQILEHEQNMNAHPNLPRLMDKTAAMGLLWVRRQLMYQTSLFANALKVPTTYSTSKDAIVAAYIEVYDRYHGWAVQKIFNYSFQSAPEAVEVFRHMNPRKLDEVKVDLRNGKLSRSSPTKESNFTAANADENPVAAFFGNIGNDIGNWWNEVTNKKKSTPIVGSDDDQFEQLVSAAMENDASQHIAHYMTVVEPILNDLAGVFDKYNMDDPTKV
uniref:Glycolipid transfer protein domain-containing protein n=2 Tax=Amphora coffeiformis TaxID=265554 RepID=A0A7S3KZF6_9STRA|eukprot:scaffold12_cov155-Amphora_coffeaeformis.AAC.5